MDLGETLEVRSAGAMGQGLFAPSNIPIGTRILVENPLMWVPLSPTPYQGFCQALTLMDDSSKKDLRDLHCNTRLLNQNLAFNLFDRIRSEDPQATIDMRDDDFLNVVKLFATFCTNAVTITEGNEDTASAVYPIFSHINHSCTPNAFVLYSSENKQQTLYAGCDIMAGQQIFVSYLGGDEDFLTSWRRMEETRKYWNFACTCSRCLDPMITDMECARRYELRRDLVLLLGTGPPDACDARQALALQVVNKAEELLGAMEDGDLGYWKFYPLYQECARFNQWRGNRREAVRYVVKYVENKSIFCSEDEIDLDWVREIGLPLPE
ncbi:hypothetical protein DHEL01_v207170 [Diaporthe helianthi]|uniref:SET domain-containing protein n=1 Tax=Diaporthe helianthi TaxID=158607 RepID=A0A2P5HVZ0_DIAHE|nr:hypothetical protein DHEL01_v207170 [Diaporthe helianthi]